MESIINFYQITDDIGTSGQPTSDQFSTIAAAGYTTVINLAMHNSDTAIAEEGSIVSSLGMTYIHIPVPFEAPSINHLAKFFAVMDALHNEKVFVHCQVNARVSAFMHQYLTLKKGYSSEDASSPLLLKWLPEMDEKWKAVLEMNLEDMN